MADTAVVGNRKTHHKERQVLRRKLELRGLPAEEITAAVEVLRSAQLARREAIRRPASSCPEHPRGLHAWRYGKGKRRCRQCGEEQETGVTKGEWVRQRLRKRDGDLCQLCAGRFTEDDPATIDHVKPKVDGGSDSFENLRLAHQSCNWIRGRGQDPRIDGRTGRPHRCS